MPAKDQNNPLDGCSTADEIARARRDETALCLIILDLDHIAASAGVAEWRGPDETLAALIERADRALYAAKRSGRDRAVLATDELERRRAAAE